MRNAAEPLAATRHTPDLRKTTIAKTAALSKYPGYDRRPVAVACSLFSSSMIVLYLFG